MSSVLQPWVEAIPWKCQSILFSGLRGPDHSLCPYIKHVSRWMRSVSQHNADTSKDYMNVPALTLDFKGLDKELEHSPCHFVHHFADALRVIAIWHPSQEVRQFTRSVHYFIAEEIFHFVPESDEVFIKRHCDKVEHD